MVNAMLYQARTGCQWRNIPPSFGPWGGAIWQQFRRRRDKGVWTKALDLLRRAARVDSARPHDAKAGRLLCDTALPQLPRVTDLL
jgi:putative transposase